MVEKSKGVGLGLLSEFAPASVGEWRAAAEAGLKGVPFEKKLLSKTHEGITLQPIYHAQDAEGLAQMGEWPGFGSRVRGFRASGRLAEPWLISQEQMGGTPEEFNAVARQELMRGVTELNVLLDVATAEGLDPDEAAEGQVGACGVSLSTLRDFEKAFHDIDLSAVPVVLRAGIAGLPVGALFLALARKRGIAAGQLRGGVEMDPLGVLARSGSLAVPLERAYDEMAVLARYVEKSAPGWQTVWVGSGPVHNHGGNAVQELAWMLGAGVEYFRALEARGVAPAAAAGRFRLELAVGANFFMELAKLRAARMLWSRVLEALGVPENARTAHLHARTGLWNKTALDPHVNILRGGTEAFAAVLGGVDSLHVGAFDEVFQVPDAFSRRVARNTQVILQEECELGRVMDPAGGAWFVEWLTAQLAEKAWARFQELEEAGGLSAALAQGSFQAEVAEMGDRRLDLLGQRREVLVGINQYPNPAEVRPKPRLPDYAALRARRAAQVAQSRTSGEVESDVEVMERLDALASAQGGTVPDAAVAAALAGASIGELGKALRREQRSGQQVNVRAMPSRRWSAAYEKMREACWKHEEKTGARPRVHLAQFGASRGYRIRADWTSAFFGIGGLEVVPGVEAKDARELVAAALASPARLVVLVSSDENYPSFVETAARGIKAGDPGKIVWLAGAPGDQEAAWKAAGVDGFVNVRCNHYETLKGLLAQAGVELK